MASIPNGAAPIPPDVTCTINPLLDLLAAFPVPQLAAIPPTRNCENDVAHCEPDAAREEAITNTIEESARTLIASSSYELLREATVCIDSSVATVPKGGSIRPTLSPLAQRIHERLLQLEKNVRVGGIRNVPGGGSPHKGRVPWERQPARQMTLRPRREPSQDAARTAEQEDGSDSPRIETKQSPMAVQKNEQTYGEFKTEAYRSVEVADIFNENLMDSKSLDALLGMLSSATQPFRDVEGETITAFLTALVQPSVSPPSTKKKCLDDVETDISVELMERVIACCSCVSHPSFNPSHIPEDLINHLITKLAVLLRQVARRASARSKKSKGTSTELQCLRALLGCFSLLVSDERLDVCSPGELIRLEELCYQSLFVATTGFGHQEVVTYAAYVMSHALQLYRCLWNHLKVERDITTERFFLQLPLGGNLLLRLQQLPSGEKVMPLTAAVVNAAQSLDIGTETIGLRDAECLVQQCRSWAARFVQHFVLGKRELQDRDMVWTLVLQFVDDLANMLGLPEYPAADAILQSLLATLAHYASVTAVTLGERNAANFSLLPLFVEVIYRVSRVALGGSLQKALCVKVPPASRLLSSAQMRQWRYLTYYDTTATKKKGSNISADYENKNEEDDSLQVGLDDCRAILYTALSQSSNLPPSDFGDVSLHLRAAHVLTWAVHDKCFHELTLDKLVRSRHIVEGGVSVDWGMLRACSLRLSAERERSLLNRAAKERLLSLLLSVFQVWEEEPQGSLGSLEVARKKALTYIAELTELHPPLLDKIWPIVQRCARCDNARVREATVALLLTLISGICRDTKRESGLTESAVADMLTDVVSMLLHFLRDHNAAVVARSIAALDTLLTEEPYTKLFEQMSKVEHLVTFTQSKLLTLITPSAAVLEVPDCQHQAALQRLFIRRWTAQMPGDFEQYHVHIRVAKELLRLTGSTIKYPYDASESLHLVTLLRGMCSELKAVKPKRRGPKKAEDARRQALCGVMVGAAKALWSEWQRLSPGSGAAAALATIHILSMACSDWVDPLLDALAQVLLQQQQLLVKTDMANGDSEVTGITLLHVCRIMHTVLMGSRRPPLPLDPLAQVLTSLISRYVGPHQQKILLSATGALVSTITCGHDRLSKQVNTKYLTLCYSLMNTYYVHVASFAPTLRTNQCNVGYTLRFLFLLSEFLRLYPGWKHRHPELAALTTTTSCAGSAGATTVPNQLACGDGICANIYSAVELVLRECPERERGRTTVIALRVMGSLCMLQPTTYLRHCEPYIRRAIHPASDVQQQLQGLTFIRDFLRDEDSRVHEAAMAAGATLPIQWQDNGNCSTQPASPNNGCRLLKLQASAETQVEEQNSGMATWLLQQFHEHVILLCGSYMLPVRELAMEILHLCAAGGLLPPPRYTKALIVLGADPQSGDVRRTAVAYVLEQCERHGDLMVASSTAGIVKAFDLHAVCGVDVVKSAIGVYDTQHHNGQGEGEYCVHAYLFKSLHKKYRDGIVSSLMCYFHEEARVGQWMREHKLTCSGGAASGSKGLMELTPSPLPFLIHLTVVLAHIPFQLESDVVHLLDSCRTVVDLSGPSCMEFVQQQLALLQASTGTGARGSRGVGDVGVTNVTDSALDVWRCYGVSCVLHLNTFLHSAYDLRGAKRYRQSGVGRPVGRAARSDSRRVASTAFLNKMNELLQSMNVLWGGKSDAEGKLNNCKIQSMKSLLTSLAGAAGLEDTDAVLECPSGPRMKTKASTRHHKKAKKRGRPCCRLSNVVNDSSSSSSERATSAESFQRGIDHARHGECISEWADDFFHTEQ
ncbi:Sister chromatid cohesion C-terminus [Trypanosoma brucei equiperdum]|uniref:Sister chromatid cohesion protein n=1 Tax=Trypanosoma brucei equiperdum TaxID=630700 RepID=A0A3L6KRG2_9TRYP|nr:Sister chromatid cohesion C-terminus [Trypanosoma brucei equiperdum]